MANLEAALQRIDGKGYKAYRDIEGAHQIAGFTLRVDHVQADPFAAPSRLRALVPWSQVALPEHAFASEPRQRAARDYIARAFFAANSEPAVAIDAGAQSVLERTAVLFGEQGVELRFTVALPARGRSILGRQAGQILVKQLPATVHAATHVGDTQAQALRAHCDTVEDQTALRAALGRHGLVGFIADGACLARRSGVDDRPLPDAVACVAPEALRATLQAPNAGRLSGLGIPRGVTLIVGGGFHGKSTLLRALEVGVYDHCPQDGREAVVSDPQACKVRAEDGRAVHAVDLSPFIRNLPYGKETSAFETSLASGSTSQAAALQEALEAGATTVLVDEDTSATNFMIRDERMQALVAAEAEPITPFVERIRELFDRHGVSTVLVMGGSGDYFEHADTVIQMHEYEPRAVTADAHAIAAEYPGRRQREAVIRLDTPTPRSLVAASIDPRGRRGKPRTKTRATEALLYGEDEVDLRAVEQLVDPSQLRGIVAAMRGLHDHAETRLLEPLSAIRRLLAREWPELAPGRPGDVVRPRALEVMAALNRLRGARFEVR